MFLHELTLQRRFHRSAVLDMSIKLAKHYIGWMKNHKVIPGVRFWNTTSMSGGMKRMFCAWRSALAAVPEHQAPRGQRRRDCGAVRVSLVDEAKLVLAEPRGAEVRVLPGNPLGPLQVSPTLPQLRPTSLTRSIMERLLSRSER